MVLDIATVISTVLFKLTASLDSVCAFITIIKLLRYVTFVTLYHLSCTPCSGVFRTFELRVLTVIDCPKIGVLKGGDSNRLSQYYGC